MVFLITFFQYTQQWRHDMFIVKAFLPVHKLINADVRVLRLLRAKHITVLTSPWCHNGWSRVLCFILLLTCTCLYTCFRIWNLKHFVAYVKASLFESNVDSLSCMIIDTIIWIKGKMKRFVACTTQSISFSRVFRGFSYFIENFFIPTRLICAVQNDVLACLIP